MPERKTIERARRDARMGKAPSSQAGEFVREEMHHIREGKHGARSTKQAIAIGLSKARRAGVNLPPPKRGKQSAGVRAKARRDREIGRTRGDEPKYPKRSAARLRVLRHEGHRAASHYALARQAHGAAIRRGRKERHLAAIRAVRTKGTTGLRRAAAKAAHTRARRYS